VRQIQALYAFNRGIVSPLGLARSDQKRIALAAETMTNWVGRTLGSMAIRPGTQYIGAANATTGVKSLPFVFATDDTAVVEFTDSIMRVWINDVLLTRVSVATAINNGTFAGNITGWTDSSDAGGAATYAATNQLQLRGNGTARAIASQAVTIAGTDQPKEHALHLTVNRGPVDVKVGTSLGDDSLLSSTTLDTGVHSLAFTPNATTVYIELLSSHNYNVLIGSCTIEAAGVVTITSPYGTANLDNIRFDQSADVIFIACAGFQQRKVERRGTHPGGRSWSLCKYQPIDGPFITQNVTPATIAPSALNGDVTLTASTPIFASTHVGALFSVESIGQTVTASITAQNTFTGSIRVTGVGTGRSFGLTITGLTASGSTVTLQRSTDNASWSDVTSFVADQVLTENDSLDNQILYYRLGVKTGGYVAGTIVPTLTYSAGSILGVAQITAFTNSTSVTARVVKDFGGTTASSLWSEGSWSDKRGWPGAVRFHEGRLWWAGQNGIIGSVSDGFVSFDATVVGDSGPISRTIGSGPVDRINWIMSLQRLIVGPQGAEYSARSSALDSPLTPTDFALKICSTQGSGAVDPVKINQQGYYVDRTGIKVFRLDFDLANYLSPDYASTDITAIVPELGLPNIVRMAVQMKPEPRIHCVRSDGTAMIAVIDKTEDVICWQNYSTNGLVKDVVVLPGAVGSTEDQVYYWVQRTINGATVLYFEKWSKETECRGSTLNKQADAFVVFTNSTASATVSGLTHLVGASVVVWTDGRCLTDASGAIATFTVSGAGSITLTDAGSAYLATTGIAGLAYTAQWKSAKLGIQPSPVESVLNQQKKISHLGVVGAYIHPKGVQFGADFDHLDDLPAVEAGAIIDQSVVRTTYDEQEFAFPGTWTSDLRLCIQGKAPRPATLLAAVVDLSIHT
jgi:hypothetical protein